ncbi:MAG: hypothetical protein ACHREM_06480 [Polyangiales bacterium]
MTLANGTKTCGPPCVAGKPFGMAGYTCVAGSPVTCAQAAGKGNCVDCPCSDSSKSCDTGSGSCLAPPGAGQACSPTGPACTGGLVCGTAQNGSMNCLVATGAACTSANCADCETLSTGGTSCTKSCTDNSQCDSSVGALCVDDNRVAAPAHCRLQCGAGNSCPAGLTCHLVPFGLSQYYVCQPS